MLGGPDSFADGKYDRTPVGELLPVYLDRVRRAARRRVRGRIAWCSPARAGSSRGSGRGRPRTRSGSGSRRCPASRPSAAWAGSSRGPSRSPRSATPRANAVPALVAQPFGKGHVAALLIGDLWRWGMRREDAEESDLERSWRQTVRWLVSDVPSRVEVAVRPKARLRHAGRRAGGPRPRRRVSAARQRQGHAQDHPARRRGPDARRRARRARGRLVRGHLRPQAARRLSGPRDRDRAPTGRPSASARPAGPPSPPPTSSPAWSRTGIT